MVKDGVSLTKTQRYLKRYVAWWTRTSSYTWSQEDMLKQFVEACWNTAVRGIAKEIIHGPTTLLRTELTLAARVG